MNILKTSHGVIRRYHHRCRRRCHHHRHHHFGSFLQIRKEFKSEAVLPDTTTSSGEGRLVFEFNI